MGVYETAIWESDPLAPTRQDRTSGIYHPYIPDALCNTSISLSADAAGSCERAAVALAELDARARYVTAAESLSHVLLRSEALSSSRIEGLEMNVRRLLELEALIELDVPHRVDSKESEVLGTIEAMHEAIALGSRTDRMTTSDVCQMHDALLRDTRLKDVGGKFRTSQNWIGGSWYNPLGATYVPPRPEHVVPLMEDLVRFVNESQLPVLARAAIAHAQLETIHPFADGNGRCGRALIHAVLRANRMETRTVVPISLVLLTLRDQYYSALAAYRYDGHGEDGGAQSDAISHWVEFFCHAVCLACERAQEFEDGMVGLRHSWELRVRPRANSATSLLLDALPGNPVISVASAARLTNRSYPAARAAVRALEAEGILFQSSKNRKSGLYAAKEVLDAFTLYERSLATASGSTRLEHPARHVPQRPPRL